MDVNAAPFAEKYLDTQQELDSESRLAGPCGGATLSPACLKDHLFRASIHKYMSLPFSFYHLSFQSNSR